MYVDPGGLSVVIQLLIGTLAAVPMFVVIYWKQVKAFIVVLRSRVKNGKSKEVTK